MSSCVKDVERFKGHYPQRRRVRFDDTAIIDKRKDMKKKETTRREKSDKREKSDEVLRGKQIILSSEWRKQRGRGNRDEGKSAL